MADRFDRTRSILGDCALRALAEARVAVFGVGGVGGHAAETLARAGVGAIDVFDPDVVDVTNINRQTIALSSTVGRPKVEVAAERIREINDRAEVGAYRVRFGPENSAEVDFTRYDYVLDAVDSVTAKIEIVLCAKRAGVPVISAMGTGNKLDPTRLAVADIYSTSVCPLARVMRRELRRRGVGSLRVVYSTEEPLTPSGAEDPERRATPGSTPFVPAAAGIIMAAEAVREITGKKRV